MKRLFPVICVVACLSATHSFAGSATWKLDPVDSTWGNPANWEEGTVPDGPDDIATFNASNQTAVSVSISETEVNQLIFNPGASVFSITITQGGSQNGDLIISGTGITNNSGKTQNFVVDDQFFYLEKGATAGDMTSFTVKVNSSMFFLIERARIMAHSSLKVVTSVSGMGVYGFR